MPVGKYSTEIAEEAFNVLATTGIDSAACKAIGISLSTFYTWVKRYPEFCEGVNQARDEYRRVKHHALKRAANKALLDYLTGKMVKVSHVRKEVVTALGEIVELEEHHTSPVGVPRWAVERVLGQPLSEVEAIMALADQGIVPEWVVEYAKAILAEAREKIAEAVRGTIPESEIQTYLDDRREGGQQGISEEVFSTIRAQIMGIDASSASALSNSVPDESD